MATAANDIKIFKLTAEEEQEIVLEWNDLAVAVGYLEELKNFYGHKAIAIKLVNSAKGKLADAHLWANKVRILAKTIAQQSHNRQLLPAEEKAIRFANDIEKSVFNLVELTVKLESHIEKGEIDEAEKVRRVIIASANGISKYINLLRKTEEYAEKLERHFIM